MASSTFVGCSSAFGTRAQCFFTVPSGPTHTVERMTPVTFFPYIIFSPKAPQAVIVFLDGSDSSVNGSLYFARNFVCDAASSAETPSTTTPSFCSVFQSSRNPQASFVQPGVSSFG